MLKLYKLIKSITHGVAFVPLLITLILTIVALVVTLIPGLQDLNSLVKSGGYFEVQRAETARLMLSSILTGMVSLTVFGFSMMMVVVNQASSNYSPKVVETLTLKRSNQYILGIYLGTIVFTLVVMMHLDGAAASGKLPQLALVMNMLLSIYSILLFVKFINNISNSVRITTITENIFNETKESIRRSGKLSYPGGHLATDGWNTYQANHSGYFQSIRSRPLIMLLRKLNIRLLVLPRKGEFYTARSPLFKLSGPADDDSVNNIRSHFLTYPQEVIADNFMYGFRQLSEVAIKALSPGINDAGVARICIDYLGELLRIYLQEDSKNAFKDDSGEVRVIMHPYSFVEMLDYSITPIKTYASKDYTIIICMLQAFQTISLYDDVHSKQQLLNTYSLSIIQDAENIPGFLERGRINDVLSEMNGTGYFKLPLLEAEAGDTHR